MSVSVSVSVSVCLLVCICVCQGVVAAVLEYVKRKASFNLVTKVCHDVTSVCPKTTNSTESEVYDYTQTCKHANTHTHTHKRTHTHTHTHIHTHIIPSLERAL